MKDKKNFYINGKWQAPKSKQLIEVVNPSTEEKCAVVTLGNNEDVDIAVSSAKEAYNSWAFSSKEERHLKNFEFEKTLGDHAPNQRLLYEPKGVCALITPWNWPMNQVCLKVIPALASGCTMVLKPSELAPLSSMVLTEIIDETKFPPGVFLSLIHI